MGDYQSHGTTLARKHLRDWLILIFLIAMLSLLSTSPPFYRFVGKYMMNDLKYPHKPNTIPLWAIPVRFFFTENLTFLKNYHRKFMSL